MRVIVMIAAFVLVLVLPQFAVGNWVVPREESFDIEVIVQRSK